MPYDENGYFFADPEVDPDPVGPIDDYGNVEYYSATPGVDFDPFGPIDLDDSYQSWTKPATTAESLIAAGATANKTGTTRTGLNTGGYYGLRNATGLRKTTGVPQVRSIAGSYTANQLPTLDIKPFSAPTRNLRRVSSLTQQNAAPGLRKLERQTSAALASTQGLPIAARRMTLRDALSGYGEGVSNIMGSARKAAQSQYEHEYGTEYDTARVNWLAQMEKEKAQYNAELDRLWRIATAAANQ